MYQKPKQVSFPVWRELSSQRCLLNVSTHISETALGLTMQPPRADELSFWMGPVQRLIPLYTSLSKELICVLLNWGWNQEPHTRKTGSLSRVTALALLFTFYFEKRSLHKLSRPTLVCSVVKAGLGLPAFLPQPWNYSCTPLCPA